MINILEVVSGAFRERFASRDLRIELSLPENAVVFGDRDRLMQLFNNLLENSLRYTDAGGALRISGKCEAQRFALTFADTAPGVSDEQLSKLFERFTAPKVPATAPAVAPGWGWQSASTSLKPTAAPFVPPIRLWRG